LAVVWFFIWDLQCGLITWASVSHTGRVVRRIAEAGEEEREKIFGEYGVVKEGGGEKADV
jgi:hypothetical protein